MILIVDDDYDVRTMIKRALHELGYPAIEAADGAEGIAMFEEHRPDLVILDYMMPGMDGAEVAREITRIDADAPIIFSTGHGALRALRAAAGENISILEKPFALSELDALLAERIERRRVV